MSKAPFGFVPLIVIYVLAHAAIQLWTPNLGRDQTIDALFAQQWSWGASYRNPPLYTWALTALNELFGAHKAAQLILKFGALLAMYLCLFAAAKRLFESRRMAAVAGASPLAMEIFAWDAIRHYTHSIFLSAVIAATFLVVLRLCESRRPIDFLAFAVLIALGVLTKYGYLIFAVTLLLAMALQPRYRQVLINPWMIASLVLALLLVLPHALHLYQHSWVQIQAEGAHSLQISPARNLPNDTLAGLSSLAENTLQFTLPLPALLVLCFPAVLWRWRTQADEATLLLRTQLLAAALVLIAGIFVLGMTEISRHYLIGVFFLFPLWACKEIDRAYAKGGMRGGLNAVVCGLGFFVALAFAYSILEVFYAPHPPIGKACKRCYAHRPYDEIAAQIRDQVGGDFGTILSYDHLTGGNLLLRFPEARVLTAKYPQLKPPRSTQRGCLVIGKPGTLIDVPLNHSSFGQWVRKYIPVERLGDLDSDVTVGKLRAPLYFSDTRFFELEYASVADGIGECR
ncbi:MAG: glycosyltransferase family 39 protein [Pseudomonadota bacterium]